MTKYLLAVASVLFLAAASAPSNTARPVKPGAVEVPSEINIPSSVGEVVFRHQVHIRDFKVACVECHHQINAKKLNTPHPDYLKSSWINCRTCHSESEKVTQKVYVCSECHHPKPANIADETLSAKVVIHKKCWQCHGVGTAKEASKGCEVCHSGKKTL